MTDGLSEMLEPVFDPNGEFLYVLASTDAGPLKDWFSQINIDAPVRYGLYAITLRQDGPSAAPPQSDEVDLGALAKAKPSPSVIDLRPSVPLEVAEVSAIPTGPLATVLSDVNVRSGPSKDSATLSVASAGSKLAVVGEEGSWTQVTLPEGGNGVGAALGF